MRVAAFGRTAWLYQSIQRLAKEGHSIVLIGTSPPAPEYTVTEQDFADLAQQLECPFFAESQINTPEIMEIVRNAKADVAISVNWVGPISRELRALLPHGVLNAHAGDLPRFRGNACPNWAILTGESRVVVTVHHMVDELDTGPVCVQRECPLTESTYIADVYAFMDEAIPAMFVEAVQGIADGSLVPREQSTNPAASLRCYPRLPQDGQIHWGRPAEEIARLVRASAEPFAGAFTYTGEERLTVWRAHAKRAPGPFMAVPGQVVERRPDGTVAVATGREFLVLELVERGTDGRRRPVDVICSTRVRLGLDAAAAVAQLRRELADLKALAGQSALKVRGF